MRVSRRGSMFLEVCMAIVVVAAALVVIAQLLVVAARQQRALDQRLLATREAANLMERVMARPWSELTDTRLTDLALSPGAASRLPGSRLSIQIIPHDEQPGFKEIRVQVDWLNRADQRGLPVQLVAWKHRLEVESPP